MHAVGQADVERAARLPHRVVVLLVHREGEHARVALEDEGGAVAVVHVEIDDGGALDAPFLQHANRDRHVVQRTEAFAVIRKGVVESAADMNRCAEV